MAFGLGNVVATVSALVVPELEKGFAKTLSDNLGNAADKATKNVSDRISGAFSSIGKNLSVAVTAPLVGIGTKAVVDAQKISAGLAEVVSLTGASGAAALTEIKDLSAEVANLSGELGIAQETLVAGLYSAISAGVPRDNVFEFLRVAGKAAIAGVTDTNTAVDGLSTVINAFGLTSADAEKVADSLFTAVKGGKTTFQELSDSLFNVAPAAAAAGVDFQTVNAAIAALTAAGVPTSVATTQIRAALVGLQKPSKELDALFQGLGFKTRAAAIESLGLQGALSAVKDAAQGDQGALQQLLGSVEAVGATNILAGTGADKFTAELKAQADAAGATPAAFELIDTTRDFERLKVDLQNLSVTIGNVLIPVVQKVAGFLTELTATFNSLSPGTQELIVQIGGFAAAFGPVLVVTAKLITSIKTVLGVLKLLNLSLLANPFVLIAAAAIVAVVLIVKNWDRIKEAFLVVGRAIKVAWDATIGAIKKVVGAAVQFIKRNWDKLLIILTGPIGAAVVLIVKNWDRIKAAVSAAIDFIRNNWQTILAVITGPIGLAVLFITKNFDTIKAVVRAALDVIGGIFRTGVEVVKTIWGTIVDVITAPFDLAKIVVTGAIDAISAALGFLRDAADKALGPLDEIIGAGARLIGGGISFVGDKIAGRAAGGPITAGRPYIVGELGPELVVPRGAGTVIPNNALGGMAGGDTYNIEINNPRTEPASTTIPRALRRSAQLRG